MQHGSLHALAFVLVILPFAMGGLSFLCAGKSLRTVLVAGTGLLLAAASVLAALSAPFTLNLDSIYGLDVNMVVMAADFLLLGVILAVGVVRGHALVTILALAQIIGAAWLEFGLLDHSSAPQALVFDELATVMLLVVSIIGSIICVFALPYMREHEHHLKRARTRQPGFFAVLLLFLGAMNGLVLTDDLLTFYLFFEVTTLCSFLLIGHDRTEEARDNSMRALWMNSLGGFILLGGITWIVMDTGSTSIGNALAAYPASALGLVPLGLLLVAAFTKSAQIPFQSWLCGAMVAPTPVSALLHSSTMVKAGVYLAIRMAPAYAGTLLADGLVLFGSFVFLTTAILALTQSNGKKILAYSTISNLGLIFACAGLGTSGGAMAAILLIIFHALSKGLLFLCVGTIEQRIGSRDIEDMRGLFLTMPRTALVTALGVLTMILPPFGMLMGKWMVLEAVASNIPALALLAMGSGVTVAYWARFMALIMTTPPDKRIRPERRPFLTSLSLILLAMGAVGTSLAGPWIYQWLSMPLLRLYNSIPGLDPSAPAYFVIKGTLMGSQGAFAAYPLLLAIVPAAIFGILSVHMAARRGKTPVYMSGISAEISGDYIGPMNERVTAVSPNYYLGGLGSERRLTPWFNAAGMLLFAAMLVLGGM